MHAQLPQLQTPRLRLRCWCDGDREAFAGMNADHEVMRDLGGPFNRVESDRKLDRYAEAFDQYGFGRWAIENLRGEFLGCAGVMPVRGDHPLGPHDEIGWRLTRDAWGHGFATEAARAALDDVFKRIGLKEVVAYTSPDNVRSQAVMARLQFERHPSRDFTANYDSVGNWRGLVWVAPPR